MAVMAKSPNIFYLSFYLTANQATVSPPLSTALGNEGLKTLQFCEEFNKLTSFLPEYIRLKVFLKVDRKSRNWIMKLGSMSCPWLIQLCSLSDVMLVRGSGGFIKKSFFKIMLEDIYKIALFSFKSIDVVYIKMLVAIAFSMGLVVEV